MNIQLKEVTVKEMTENYSDTADYGVFGYLNIMVKWNKITKFL